MQILTQLLWECIDFIRFSCIYLGRNFTKSMGNVQKLKKKIIVRHFILDLVSQLWLYIRKTLKIQYETSCHLSPLTPSINQNLGASPEWFQPKACVGLLLSQSTSTTQSLLQVLEQSANCYWSVTREVPKLRVSAFTAIWQVRFMSNESNKNRWTSVFKKEHLIYKETFWHPLKEGFRIIQHPHLVWRSWWAPSLSCYLWKLKHSGQWLMAGPDHSET